MAQTGLNFQIDTIHYFLHSCSAELALMSLFVRHDSLKETVWRSPLFTQHLTNPSLTYSSYGFINSFPSTPSGKSLSPRCVVWAHGFNPFSFLIVFAKHPLHPFLGNSFTTSSIVSLLTRCGLPPILSKIVASCIKAPILVRVPVVPRS
jgi:hypothetical protein